MVPGANGKGKPELAEPLDLAFVARALAKAEPFVRADPAVAGDVRRALGMVRGELARQSGVGKSCKHCGKPVADGAPLCEHCGELQ